MRTFEDTCARKDLAELIAHEAASSPERIGYHFVSYEEGCERERTVTLGEVDAAARRLASLLTRQHSKPIERVIVLSTQSLDDVVCAVACLYARATFCMLPPPTDQLQTERLAGAPRSSGARLILLPQALRSALSVAAVLLAEQAGAQLLEVCEGSAKADFTIPELPPRAVAFLQYTSGSTNAPKAIAISHPNILHNLACFSSPPRGLRVETVVTWAPFFHNVGLVTLFMPLVNPVSLVVMTPRDFMARPVRWFEQINRHRSQCTFAPHSAYAFCVKSIRPSELNGLDLSCLAAAFNGAEAIDLASLRAFADMFASTGFRFDSFVPAYGLGENTSGVTRAEGGPLTKLVDGDALSRNRFEEVNASHPGAKALVSVGRALPRVEVRVMSPQSTTEARSGDIGELWVHGPSVALGYWGDLDATREVFGLKLDDSGREWLRTGDLGTVIAGEVFITGRLKEAIIVNGHNFYPADIEQTLHAAIRELRGVRIVSFSYVEGGRERVVCCVERASAVDADLQQLARAVAEQIAKTYGFWPDDTLIVREQSLPRTANGKLRISCVRDEYRRGTLVTLFSSKASGSTVAGHDDVADVLSASETVVSEIFREVLSGGRIAADDNFFALGGDSLALTRLAVRLKERVGVDIPLKYLIEYPSVRGIDGLLRHFHETHTFEGTLLSREALRAECLLDPGISPSSPGPHAKEPTEVLLTGATGFVGAYLLHELLSTTAATLHCHVRAATVEQGLLRVRENLEFYGLWKESFEARLRPVLGDLCAPLLGLEEPAFARLSERLDVIYHSGASLNFVYPYSRLKPANVVGTIAALRLACMGKAKSFHHISTFSVFDNPSHFRKPAFEEDPLDDPRGYLLGYSESKWVAEKLVLAAFERGLRGCIYRPAEVTGSSDTGIWKLNDLVSRALVSSVRAGAFPAGEMRFHMTPVDFVARAIVALSLDGDCSGRIFHLINQNVKSHAELAPMVRDLGYRAEVVPFEEWKRRLRDLPNSPFEPLQALLDEVGHGDETIEQRYGSAEPRFSVTSTSRALEPVGIRCPPVDEQLLRTYVRYFARAGYLPA